MRAALAYALLLSACDISSPTEIVLVVDTDIAEAAHFRVTTLSPSGRSGTSIAVLADQPPPRTLVLVHRGGALGPVRATIDALDVDGRAIVSVTRELAFQEGRSLTLSVFLSQACRNTLCPVVETCGDDGECRSPIVDACEYEGGCLEEDAGTPPPMDAGACELVGVTVCGVSARHLPGDRVAPAPCTPVSAASISVIGPDGAALAESEPGAFRLASVGLHRVEISQSESCMIGQDLDVVAPLVLAGDPSGTPRDIAARIGTAFVASSGGSYAVDGAGWHDLRAAVVGDISIPSDMHAVAVFGGEPFFGPHGNFEAMWRLSASAPFDAVDATRIDFPEGSREVRAMAVRADGQPPLLVETKDGAILLATPNDTFGNDLGPTYDAPWATIATRETATLGAIWLGRGDQLLNVSTSGQGALNLGSTVPITAVSARTAVADDRDASAQRLWMCGDIGVAIFDLAAFTTNSLPEPIAFWAGACEDLAVDAAGGAWVAAGAEGVVRLDPSAIELARVPVAGASIDRVAIAEDAAAREVWLLDPARETVYVLSAYAQP